MTSELTQILIVGILAGVIMGSILAGKGFGKIGNLLVGVVGAIIGSYLTKFISINLGSFTLDFGQLVLALIGATIFILLLKFFSRKRGQRNASLKLGSLFRHQIINALPLANDGGSASIDGDRGPDGALVVVGGSP